MLQIHLEQFRQGIDGYPSQVLEPLDNALEMVTGVSSDVRTLSHQLHPSLLGTLGLVSSLQVFCREFSGHHKLQVQFLHNGIPGQLPKEVTLCLFRITQEALQNVVRHSGAAQAEVQLSGNADEVDLCISDSGRGFDVESAAGMAGLGLNSMRERVRLVGGQFSIESEPSRGTRIRVRIPQNLAMDNSE